MAKHLAAAREKALAHPQNDAEIHFRRAKVRELWGTFTTDALMFEAVNAHMASLGFPAVSRATLYADKKIVGQEFNQVFAENREVLAAEHFQELSLLKHHQMEDYLKVRAENGNAAPYSDAVRKTLLTLGQMDGSVVQKHEVTGELSVMQRIQALIEVKPQVTPEVVPLLDDGEFAILPSPSGQADG